MQNVPQTAHPTAPKVMETSLQSHTQTSTKPEKIFTVPKVLHTNNKRNAYSSLFSYSIGPVCTLNEMRLNDSHNDNTP